MTIRRGTGSVARTQARNYISAEADARLQEAVRPYQDQGLNALGVDSYEVWLYRNTKSTTVCTCKRVNLLPEDQSKKIMPTQHNRDAEITVVHDSPIFGNRYTNNTSQELHEDNLDIAEEDSVDGPVVNTLYNASADCGLCYKCGFVPGYERYGFQRVLLTTHNVENAYGYNIDRSATPSVFDQTDADEGFIEFVLDVPMLFKAVRISVRNNTSVVDEPLYDVMGAPVTRMHFITNKGGTLAVRVRAEQFTHAVVEFDIGVTPLKANLSQGTKQVDWSTFNTLSNINVVLPAHLSEMNIDDILYVPRRSLTLKVADRPELRTAQGHALDWSVGTRVLQPQEPIRNIWVAQELS